MENLKLKPNKDLSANDLQLKRFLELDEQIKTLSSELERIKEKIKEQGSYSTQNYIALVEERARTSPPAIEVLIKKYGETVREICKTTIFKVVKVSPKGGE